MTTVKRIQRPTLAIDYGTVRIGLALATPEGLMIPRTLETIPSDASALTLIESIVRENDIADIVVGLPRNLNHNETAQTALTRHFITHLGQKIPYATLHQVDEAMTSLRAEQRLKQSGKPYQKEDIDGESARIMLEEFVAKTYGL